MSLQAQPDYRVPDDTARVARAAFPKGNVYLRIADTLGTIYTDDQFAALFAAQQQPHARQRQRDGRRQCRNIRNV